MKGTIFNRLFVFCQFILGIFWLWSQFNNPSLQSSTYDLALLINFLFAFLFLDFRGLIYLCLVIADLAQLCIKFSFLNKCINSLSFLLINWYWALLHVLEASFILSILPICSSFCNFSDKFAVSLVPSPMSRGQPNVAVLDV